ncbi:MAG: UDP-N-acetylmuramate dehydrogenase [Candidatus Omnitrophica bacterium]|nr:UDP-N-acetylmuramate dehydrogenase [Candidatus Omnitrophota bacterium]
MNWPKELKVRVNYPLKNKTTFRIGGPAQFFSEPKDIPELKLLLELSRKKKLPVYILGAGSNLLISDKGVRGLVIQLGALRFKDIARENGFIRAGSAVLLGRLIRFAQGESLQGLEFLAGIPGTLGGALAMNAGCWGHNIGDLVKEAQVLGKDGRLRTLSAKQIRFAYRKSSLADYIILSARLKAKKGSQAGIKKNINKYLTARRLTQDLTWPNAGCIFKNPRNKSAGSLIDLCGLKGRNIGGAFISQRHANFILNKKKASSGDVLRLMRLIKKQVSNKFNLILHPEIKIWP